MPLRKFQQPQPANDMGLQSLVAARVNAGMISDIDPTEIPDEALQLAKNVIVRRDKTKRRPGLSLLLPTKPNTNPVTRIAFIKTKDGSPYTLRMTPSTIHFRGENAWHSINISPALGGVVKDRFNTANILNTFIFANNGANPIQKIDFTAGTCKPLTSDTDFQKNYRYVLGFYNRAVGLANRDIDETEVGWSADGDATIWNPDTNQTAGFSPLVESPDDLSDFIYGGISLTNAMFILREKSIWLATKQPVPTNPFYFYPAYPGIGGNCSYSLQVVRGGVCWMDTRTEEIYFYVPGSAPQPLSTPNKSAIFKDLDDPSIIFSSFASKPNEYTIYIPQHDGTAAAWTFNFDNKAWVYNEFANVISAANVEIASSAITIDDLVGSIEDLQGTIDDLSPISTIPVPFSYGKLNGDIVTEDPTSDTDAGTAFTTTLVFKEFELPDVDENIGRFYIEYRADRVGQLSIDYSKDGGTTFIPIKTISISRLGRATLLEVKRMIRARRFCMRVTCTNSDVEILGYGCDIYPSSLTKSGE